jgi:hypothetical protein
MQNKVSKMPRSDMGFRDMGPGNMPRRPDIFGGNSFLFGRKPDMTSIRMPQKRGGGFGNLGEAIRRLQEKRGGDMGMPANPDGRVYAGGSPGLYAPGGRFNRGGRDRIMPNFGMEQMPIARRDPSALERLPMGGAPSFNPTIFGQPIPQGADFSNMPDFSQIDMSQLDLSGIPQSISQMNLPQMPEGLPSIEEIQGNRRMPQMNRGRMQPRMMMAEGDEVIDRSPEQEIFSLQTQLENLQEQLRMDRSYNDLQTIVDTSAEIEAIQKRMVEIQMEMARQKMIGENPYNLPFDPDAKAARKRLEEERRPALEEEYRSNPYNYPFNKISIKERKRLREQGFAGGGYVNGYAEGDEVMMMQENEMMAPNGGDIESMLSGMDSGEQEAMGELEQAAPEMEMIDQLVNMVVQMIQQGAGEEQVISFLREQGLDDEDIGTVLQLVAEMAETEDASMAAQNEIGADLEQLG